jgi:uncharacterized Zn-finger protein
MLRRAAPVLRRFFASSTSSTSAPGPPHAPRYQPLGVPPEGTDKRAVAAKWGSNAMDLVQAAEVIVLEKGVTVAACDGGGGALGHPLEYIQLSRAEERYPAVCKYCGNKFTAAH